MSDNFNRQDEISIGNAWEPVQSDTPPSLDFEATIVKASTKLSHDMAIDMFNSDVFHLRNTFGPVVLRLRLCDTTTEIRQDWVKDIVECGLEQAIYWPRKFGNYARSLIAPLTIGLALLKERGSSAYTPIEMYRYKCTKYPNFAVHVVKLKVPVIPEISGGTFIQEPFIYKKP